MNDGSGKAADDRQPLGLQHLADVLAVEFAQPMADLLQQRQRQRGRPLDQRQHLRPRNEIDRDVPFGHGASRTRPVLDHRHFAENLPGADLAKHQSHPRVNQSRNLHHPLLHHVNAVPVVTFLENLLPGGKLLLPGDSAQGA